MHLGTATIITIALLTLGLSAGCNFFNATPSECIEAAEDASLPDEVIEQLRKPDNPNALERAALQQALRRARIDDVCEITSESSLRSDGTGTNDNARPTLVRIGTGDEQPESSSTSKTTRNGGQAQPGRPEAQEGARMPDDEHRRRCRFWAHNNLQPVVYSEFASLNPDTMDHLDRIPWRSQIKRNNHLAYYDDDPDPAEDEPLLLPRNPGIYCRDYWAEPLNRDNADLRNQGFEAECRSRLEDRIANRYQRLRDWVHNDNDNELVFQTPNQYVRILQWLDLSGDGLRNADIPPYQILQIHSRHPYAHWYDWVPTEDGLIDYVREYETTLDLEWLGIVRAAGLSEGSTDIQACHYHSYPQLFYGYWVPFDPDQMPDTDRYEDLELPRCEGATTPVYLPKVVTEERIRAGYPLGKTAERYHLCQNSSGTEEVGYYYVDHPAGDYCERKP